MDLIRLADFHIRAVLPRVRRGVDRVAGLVVQTLEALAFAVVIGFGRPGPVLVVLAHGQVLGTEVPVHVDRAQSSFGVRGIDRFGTGFQQALVSPCHVGPRLLHGRNKTIDDALVVVKA